MKFHTVMTAQVILLFGIVSGCAHKSIDKVSPDDAAKLDQNLVRDAVVFEPGTKDGAVVPEISAPRLRAIWIGERIEGNRLIEAHREWILEGDITLLGIPKGRLR